MKSGYDYPNALGQPSPLLAPLSDLLLGTGLSPHLGSIEVTLLQIRKDRRQEMSLLPVCLFWRSALSC